MVEPDAGRLTYAYDLTRERRSGANSYDITYTYDPAGNRKTKVEDGGRTRKVKKLDRR